jgi:hypothetical protein
MTPETQPKTEIQRHTASLPQINRKGTPSAVESAQDQFKRDLLALPSDWRLCRVGSNKRPLAGDDWYDNDQHSPDDAVALNGSSPPAWGLLTGELSGVIVLDLDADGWRESFQQTTGHPISDLPPTISWTSGKPGRSGHAFAVDLDWWPHLRNRVAITRPWRDGDPLDKDGQGKPQTIWELRGDRHQAVIIGAHPETGSYRWLPGRSPHDIPEPAPAPDWLLECMVVQEHPDAPPVEPTAEDATRAVAMLDTIPAAEHSSYDSWLSVGMALHHTDPGLLSAWVEWSRPMTSFDQAECLAKWESFGKGHKGQAVTIRTLYYLAKQNGYREPKRSRKRSSPPPPPHAGKQQPHAPEAQVEQEQAATAEEKLAVLRSRAALLLADRAAYAERLPIMRAAAEELRLSVRDAELQAMLTAARRARTGSDEAIRPGDWLEITPTAWLWEGVFMRGCLNLLVAMPKQGKTSLVTSYIAAHHRHDPAFLDRTLSGPCPPVLIVGTDQGANDWGRMLEEAGLAERHGDRVRIGAPIVGLHHAGRPLHLDPEGIDRIAAEAQAHPGLLIVVDSLAACVAPLGLKEESAQIAEPIHDLMEQVEPHGATVVLIHHASKGHAGEAASMASRGSTALPAVASQTIKLGPATAASNDTRRLLSTEGRGGAPISLVIQREGGSWDYVGTAETLQQEQAEADVQKGLNDRQADTLDLVKERWDHQMARTAAADVVHGLALTGKDPATLALRTLKALERKGFLSSIQTKAGEKTGGRPSYMFWPRGAGEVSDTSRDFNKHPSKTSKTSETSLAPEDPHWINLSPEGVSDVSDVSYTCFGKLERPSETPSETVGNPRPVSAGHNSLPEHSPLAPVTPAPVGSGADVADDGDDPHWSPRSTAN